MYDFKKAEKPSPFDFAPRKKKDRNFLYNLYDNFVGVDDGVNSPGERLGKGVNDLAKGLASDPLGMAGRAVQGVNSDLHNLMFEGGAMQRPEDVLAYAAAPMAPGVTGARVANVLSANGAKPGIKAYQGSPHNFAAERLVRMPDGSAQYIVGKPDILPDIPQGAELVKDFPLGRMRMDKLGTGEGAQAYGHGIYAAENEGVAKGYRDALSRQVTKDGNSIGSHPSDGPKAQAENSIARMVSDGWSPEDAIRAESADWRAAAKQYRDLSANDANPDVVRSGERTARSFDDIAKAIESENPASYLKNPGSMYEVNIDANPDDFLDWDAPLSAQPGVAAKLGYRTRSVADLDEEAEELFAKYGFYEDMPPDARKRLEALNDEINLPPANISGEQAYSGGDEISHLQRVVSGKQFGPDDTKALRERGIPGIKYLDQGSRPTAGGEFLGVQAVDGGYTAKIRVDGRGGAGFQTPTQQITTSKPFASEAEAKAWADNKLKQGTRNYVVFDENLISIVRKYGVAGAATMLGVGASDVQAAIDQGQQQ